ncbi:hypothetical protein [Comamonas terrigena]|uniref:hypothetical protein n=1 Tax=Comamonas terrigena TaxID=32013 RepID=UPI00289CA06E|nr:hypothetical protein [Comamonas terrigena]
MIEIHGSNRVDVVHLGGVAWSVDVKSSEPILIDRTSFGLDASHQDFIIGLRRSRYVYRPMSSDCHVLIVINNRGDIEEASNMLAQSHWPPGTNVCTLRN